MVCVVCVVLVVSVVCDVCFRKSKDLAGNGVVS